MKQIAFFFILLFGWFSYSWTQIEKTIQAGTCIESTVNVGVCPLCPSRFPISESATFPQYISFEELGLSSYRLPDIDLDFWRVKYRICVSPDAPITLDTSNLKIDTVYLTSRLLNLEAFDNEYEFKIIITESLQPEADFLSNRTELCAGSTIKFTNLSENAVTEWIWDFGDGEFSNERDPIHQFSDTGSFSVVLIANGPAGVDSAVEEIEVYPEFSPGCWKWDFEASNGISGNLALDQKDRIFFVDHDDDVYCLTGKGELVWKEYVSNSARSTPVVGPNNILYITAREEGSTVIYALDPDSGNEIWKFSVLGKALEPTVAADSNLYLATSEKLLYTIEKDGNSSSNSRMEDNFEGVPVAHAIGVDGTYFVLTTYSLFAYENNLSGFQEKWKWPRADNNFRLSHISIATNGDIFLTGQKIYVLSYSGEEKWSFPPTPNSNFSETTAAILDSTNKIYVGGYDTNQEFLFVFDDQGNIKKQIPFEKKLTSPIQGDDKGLYIYSEDDTVYSINGNTEIDWKFYHSENGSVFPRSHSPLILSDGTLVSGIFNRSLQAVSTSSKNIKLRTWSRVWHNQQNTQRNILFPPILDRVEVVGGQFNFYWLPVDQAVNYEFEIYLDSVSGLPIYEEFSIKNELTNLNLGNVVSGTCYWRVRARVGSKIGAWSDLGIISFDSEINIHTYLEDEIKNQLKISFFPNPTKDFINFHFESQKPLSGHLQILTWSGQILYSSKLFLPQGKTILELQNKSILPGIYFYRFISNEVQMKGKLYKLSN